MLNEPLLKADLCTMIEHKINKTVDFGLNFNETKVNDKRETVCKHLCTLLKYT